jgi:transposase-like protein
MPKHKSEDYKLLAVQHYLEKKDNQIDTCNLFKCSPRSLMRWVRRYKLEQSIKRHNRIPIAYKVKKIHIKFILDEISKNKTITIQELLSKLNDRFKDLDISLMHLHRLIKQNHITLKITKLRHEPIKRFGKDINIDKQIKEFYENIKQYDINDIICIDETSINALQSRHLCYSEKGKRCVVKTNSQEVFKKYTAIFAISVDGVIGYTLYEKGGIDSERLVEFLDTYITNKYKNKVILLDNASSHRNDNVKHTIMKNNKFLYSVPYQHYTNAIEMFFSMLKSKLQKKSGLLHSELNNNIKEVIKTIPQSYYKNILKGTYNRSNYMKKKVIRKYKNYKD